MLLEADISALKNDHELAAIVDDISTLPIAREAARAAQIGAWLDKEIGERGAAFQAHVLAITHGYVRLTKSVCLLYIGYLRGRRDVLAQRPQASTHLLSSVDSALAALEESMESGVFKTASQVPLLVSDVCLPTVPQPPAAVSPPAPMGLPRTILLPSIEIADAELRSRCVDLYTNFSEDGQHDRLDTVVTEATRILEDRLRRRSGAPETTVGVELATFAFSGAAPRILVSSIPAEQEAAHLMFRGLFGFVRNHVHHRLIGRLEPQRVLQILGMIDYLLSLSGPTGAEVEAKGSA